jgi:[protein-PII] uridylyltransferase
LLAALADRTTLVLSGQHYKHQEEQHLELVKDHVLNSIAPLEEWAPAAWQRWVEQQLSNFPPHYLTGVSPAQIAADVDSLQQLQPGDIVVDGVYDSETDTVDYRIIIEGPAAAGCFHKMAGALTANRLEIVDAQINTSLEGIVVDRFRVVDRDFAGATPQHRIDEVCDSIRAVLTGHTSVIDLFQRFQRFGTQAGTAPISGQVSRVVIDNESTASATIIDVFAHDRPGLLYMLARTLYDLGLSVMLAKIGTHVDQVVDVFYISEQSGDKISDGQRLGQIRDTLIEKLAEFESQGSLQFAT